MFEYYGKIQDVRGNLMGLPGWARFVLFIVALPLVAVLCLSIAAVLCSFAALLLVTVPVYRLLRLLTGRPRPAPWAGPEMVMEAAGRRHVDVKIVE